MNAIIPGTFDPITLGHLSIINIASTMFEKLFIVVAWNSNKKSLFSLEERMNMINKVVDSFSNVSVISSRNLIVDVAKSLNSNIIIRGIRNHLDLDYETEMFYVNRTLSPFIHTIFIPSEQQHLHITSSAVRELINFRCDIKTLELYVPNIIISDICKLTGLHLKL